MNIMTKITLILIALTLVFCSGETNQKSREQIKSGNYLQFFSEVRLPDKLEWCGEEVPLDIPEVRERAEREFYLLLQQPGQLMLYIKRAGRYFPVFEKIISDSKMPSDLKYLSVAESALYMSRSAKDAVGLWQFIPETAQMMGLIVNDQVDERRHVAKSTRAAMKYLKQGYNSSKSWFMAAAGYNMGHENLQSQAQFQGSAQFFDLFLNEETSRYVLRIVLIKELMVNGDAYGLTVSKDEIYKEDDTKTVRVTGKITNLTEWAKRNRTTYKDVKLLNPWILKRELPNPPNGYWEVLIPE
jgi:hypothetical protein